QRRPGGVVRGAQQHQTGAIGDRRGHRLEVVLRGRGERHLHPHPAVGADEDRVRLEGAPGEDHLVALADQGPDQVPGDGDGAGGGARDAVSGGGPARDVGGEVLGDGAQTDVLGGTLGLRPGRCCGCGRRDVRRGHTSRIGRVAGPARTRTPSTAHRPAGAAGSGDNPDAPPGPSTDNDPMRFLGHIIVTGLALWVTALLLPGMHLGENSASTLTQVLTIGAIALILALINTIVKPILEFLAFPLTCVTLGLFQLVINTLMLLLASWVSGLLG